MKEAYKDAGCQLMGYADKGFRGMSSNKGVENISGGKEKKKRSVGKQKQTLKTGLVSRGPLI